MARSPWPHFRVEELKCNCGCGRWQMDHDFMAKVERLRVRMGFQFIVNSAYRCPEHNAEVSKTGLDGPHTTGRAMDIKIYGPRADQLIDFLKAFGMTGRGIHQKGKHENRFIHFDDLPDDHNQPRPWTWSY